MSTGPRTRLAGAAAILALALTVVMAMPASAATHFVGISDNGKALATLDYHYDRCNSAGYCRISVTNEEALDPGYACGDGWGAALLMHYKRSSTGNADQVWWLVTAWDCDPPQDDTWGTDTGYKDVWFEVCNWNPETDEHYDCGRLQKKT